MIRMRLGARLGYRVRVRVRVRLRLWGLGRVRQA